MVTDTIADMLTRVRNAQERNFPSVRVPATSVGERILEVLKAEGLISYYERRQEEASKFAEFEVGLKYTTAGRPVMETIRRVSTSGRRVYQKVERLPHVLNGLGIAVLSTSQGVMSDREARKRGIGGEVLAIIS